MNYLTPKTLNVSPKTSAFQRVAEKWRKAQQENMERVKKKKQRDHAITQTFRTEGWKHITKAIESGMQELKNELYKTSSLRVFKCMELRNEINALSRLYSAMKTEEASILLRMARE